MLLDIVILPPQKLRQEIGKNIRIAVGSYPHVFLVDNKKLIPHLSLWHVNTSRDRIGDIEKESKQIVRNQKPIKINSDNFRYLEERKNNIEFTVKENRALASLREKVFKKVYPYKTGAMPPFFGKWKPEKMEQVRKYGRPPEFHPHFTMGWLKHEEHSPDVVKRMKGVKFSFLANEIYICEVDEWWQVTKIIKKIKFAQK